MPGFDMAQVARNDRGIIGGAIAVFIASFMPYWGISAGPYTASTNAWTGYATFGLLLAFVAGGIVAFRVFTKSNLPQLPLGMNLIVAALAVLGALLIILRGFTYPHHSFGAGYSYGVKWGGYIVMLAAVVEAVFAVMNFRSSGEKIAWDATAMNRPGSAPAPGAPQTGSYVPPSQPMGTPGDQPAGYTSGDQTGGSA
jgi:hypothetical protein